MANIAPQPRFRAFDSNGDPLSGGLLYTYEAGTTTPKETYTTEAGDVANTNPVVLDSDGYADVWLGDGGYKFVLKDSTDVTLWTVDDLGGTTSTAFGSQVNAISTNTNITALYANSVNICTSSPTLSLLPAADAGEGFYINVKNADSGATTIDPDASETIDGSATASIGENESALIICNGTTWYTLFLYTITTEFSDSTFRIQDNGDATKEIAFEASSITTGTTRTITIPDSSGTLFWIGDVLDEDDMVSDSDVYPPTQQSVKAYVAFTEYFESAEQTITSAGLLTIAHGLSGDPKFLECVLICKTTEDNWAVDDEIIVNVNQSDAGTTAMNGLYFDGTNVYFRFSNISNCFKYANKTTGVSSSLTNGNWRLKIRASY
jgi:hypothetical protein